jgi:hypothetical protein
MGIPAPARNFGSAPQATATIEIITIPLVVALIRRLEAVSAVAAMCGGALASVLKAVLSLTLCYYDNRGLLAADVSAAASLQTFAMINLMSCSTPAAKQSPASLRVLGPLPIGSGFMGVVAGNLALAAGAFVLQVAALPAAKLMLKGTERERWADACGDARFPSLALMVVVVLHQGTSYAAVQLLSLPYSSALDRAVGAAVLLLLLSLPVSFALAALRWLPRSFYCYKAEVRNVILRVPRLLRWFVPIGRIEPRNTRNSFGCIVAAYKDPRSALSASSMVPGLVSSLLTAWHPADLAQCAAQFGMLSAVLLGFAAGFVWLWPYRLRHQCYLTPAGLAANGVTTMLSGAALYHEHLLGPALMSVLLTEMVVIQVALFVLTVFSTVAEAIICDAGAEEERVERRRGAAR